MHGLFSFIKNLSENHSIEQEKNNSRKLVEVNMFRNSSIATADFFGFFFYNRLVCFHRNALPSNVIW